MITIAVLFSLSAMPAVLISLALAFLRLGIAREDAGQSLRTGPPTRACAIIRRVTGLHADPARLATLTWTRHADRPFPRARADRHHTHDQRT
jgi:hypothetical protein